MNVKKCVEFANKNPVSWVASVEGDQPRVRALGMWFADKSGYYFQIRQDMDMYKQLQKNPKVETSFWEPGAMFGTMMRLAGEVEFLDDIELKKKVLKDRPFLKDFGFTSKSPELVIFRISKGEAYFWTMESAFEPKKMIEFGK
jgi:uncharacterized pyridoxamine 5'-phosphate oxidase family protein